MTRCVTNSVQYTCPSYCVFSAILIRGIKYQHAYDRTTTSTRTVGTKFNNTPQQTSCCTYYQDLHKAQHITGAHAFSRSAHILQKSWGHLTSTADTRVTTSKLLTEDSQMLHTTAQNLVFMATWRPGYVHLQAISIHWHVLMSITSQSRSSNRWIRLHGIRPLRQCAEGSKVVPPASLLAPPY